MMLERALVLNTTGQHAGIKKEFADRYSKLHVTKPDVAFVIQENVDAFVARVTEHLGESVDIYVRRPIIISSSSLD